MPAPLIAVTDSVFPNLDAARRVAAGIGAQVTLAASAAPADILAVARDADAILTTYAPVSADIIGALARCRIIARFGIGVDNVDVAAASRRAIVVTRVPDYCVDEVSEHAMALILAIMRKVTYANACVQAGRWDMPAVVPIHRLKGQTLGLVGFGRIPRLVAPKARAFGFRVVASDPFVSTDAMAQLGVEKVDFVELVAAADCISLHCPLTPDTRHLFGADVFARMKRGAYLVNTGRGPLIDEAALAAALDSGQVAGAALDVVEREPPIDSPLLARPNVILTPHVAFYSEESLIELQTKAAEEVVRVLGGGVPLNPVNPEVLAAMSGR